MDAPISPGRVPCKRREILRFLARGVHRVRSGFDGAGRWLLRTVFGAHSPRSMAVLAMMGYLASPVIGWEKATGGALLGMALVGCLRPLVGGMLRLRNCWRRDRAGHRFLCSSCLYFSRPKFVCSCGSRQKLHEAALVIEQWFGTACRACREARQPSPGYEISCPGCRHRSPHHAQERRVRLVATLRHADADQLLGAADATLHGLRYGPLGVVRSFCVDDGECRRCVFDLSRFEGRQGTLSRLALHASTRDWSIWIDDTEGSVLEIARAVDALLRWSKPEELWLTTVYLRSEQPDPTVLRHLESRFRQVRTGYPPERVLGTLPTASRTCGPIRAASQPGTEHHPFKLEGVADQRHAHHRNVGASCDKPGFPAAKQTQQGGQS